MKLRLVVLLAAGVALAAAGARAAESPDEKFVALGNEFLDGWLTRRPHLATRLGLHGWDSKLAAVTTASVDSDLKWLADMRARLREIPLASLTVEHAQEHDLLAARIERERIELAEVRAWEKNPSFYLDLVAGSVLAVLERDFASPCERVVLATRRLRQVPEVLRAAKVNLKNPPRIFTEVAISQFAGSLDFYRRTAPSLTLECREPLIHADFAEADSLAVHAVERFLDELRNDVLPRSTGDFALGRDLYQRRLEAAEMDPAPVESLLAAGWRALDDTRNRMAAVSERIAPGLGVAAALDSLRAEAPAETALVGFVEGQLDTIRAFLRKHPILSMPASENLIVRETPSFRRGLTFASMNAPGVWERHGTQAYYEVTPADPSSSEKDKRDHLAFWNRFGSQIVSIHEALPGHYYQFLALQGVPSRLRQALRCGTNTEGWAHYCEEMMVEEGYGGGDPRFELAQLEMALRRIGRLIAGISLHTGAMSLDDAARMFEERCFMAPVNAAREARRGTSDPGYLVYTLGKWRILQIRDEARQMLGPAFRLREFHDVLLRQGGVPLALAREGVLLELGRRHRAAGGDR